jgi:hypothetical protein
MLTDEELAKIRSRAEYWQRHPLAAEGVHNALVLRLLAEHAKLRAVADAARGARALWEGEFDDAAFIDAADIVVRDIVAALDALDAGEGE